MSKPSGTVSVTTGADRMAIIGLVCSLCVPVLAVLLIPVGNMPSTDEAVAEIFYLLLLTGATLWISGLVLSLMARNKATKRRWMATTGIIVSASSPLLFLAVLIVVLLQVADWYFNEYFTMGVPISEPPRTHPN